MNRSYPKELRRTAVWLLLILGGLSVSGCSVAHMALPEDSQGEISEMPVEGLGLLIVRSYFDFAPYHISDVHRGWINSSGYNIFGFSDTNAKQNFEFSVDEKGRATWNVKCTSRADWNTVDVQNFLGKETTLEFSYDRSLACVLKQEGVEKRSRIFMAQSAAESVMEGVVKDGDVRIDISVTYKFDFTPVKSGEPTGYLFHIGGRFVGAVEVMNMGTVWMHNSTTPETRSALAVASAVLLMYQDIKEVKEGIS